MIRVCLAGATGWAGSELARAIATTDDIDLVASISRAHAGRTLGEALGDARLTGRVYATANEALASPCDVFVEYTHPETARSNVLAALDHGAHVVSSRRGCRTCARRVRRFRSTRRWGPREARGTTLSGTQVHSIRLPGYVISAEVVFGMPDQRLSIRHDSGGTARPYVDGALLAIRRVGTLAGLHRGLDTVLDL